MKRFSLFLVLAIQVALSASPFVPIVRKDIWSAQTSVNAFASTLAAYVGLQFVCLGALIGLALLDLEQQTKKSTNSFATLLQLHTPLQARRLKEGDFYKEFLGNCMKARHYVKICYFSAVPPDHGAPSSREAYYKEMIRVMKHNPTTVFKRIIRDSTANRSWAEQLAIQLGNTTNCSIAMLKDMDESHTMPLALSVQIIDGTDSWLVAVAEHAGSDMYRDLAISNLLVAEAFDKYFDRLWDLSTIVFQPGYSQDQIRHAIFEGDR